MESEAKEYESGEIDCFEIEAFNNATCFRFIFLNNIENFVNRIKYFCKYIFTSRIFCYNYYKLSFCVV